MTPNRPIIQKKDIGRRICTLRRRHSLSQSVLAEKTNLTESYISMIETGKKLPSVSSLVAIATVLDASIDYIILGTDSYDSCANCEILTDKLSGYTKEERRLLLDFIKLVNQLPPH